MYIQISRYLKATYYLALSVCTDKAELSAAARILIDASLVRFPTFLEGWHPQSDPGQGPRLLGLSPVSQQAPPLALPTPVSNNFGCFPGGRRSLSGLQGAFLG